MPNYLDIVLYKDICKEEFEISKIKLFINNARKKKILYCSENMFDLGFEDSKTFNEKLRSKSVAVSIDKDKIENEYIFDEFSIAYESINNGKYIRLYIKLDSMINCFSKYNKILNHHNHCLKDIISNYEMKFITYNFWISLYEMKYFKISIYNRFDESSKEYILLTNLNKVFQKNEIDRKEIEQQFSLHLNSKSTKHISEVRYKNDYVDAFFKKVKNKHPYCSWQLRRQIICYLNINLYGLEISTKFLTDLEFYNITNQLLFTEIFINSNYEKLVSYFIKDKIYNCFFKNNPNKKNISFENKVKRYLNIKSEIKSKLLAKQ